MIPAKEKPCKGTGLAKGYGCGKLTKFRTYGLGKMCCYPDWLLNSENGKIILEKATLKATKPRRDLEKAQKERKERKGLPALLVNVRTACHDFIKARDEGKPCISCGVPWSSDFQAGHYFKAELYSNLKFHEDNIHGQCQPCNLRKEGNLGPYSVNLPRRIGVDKFQKLNELAKQHEVKKWDREELNQIRKYYKQKLKELLVNT